MINLRKSRFLSPIIQNIMPDLAEFMTTQEAARKMGFTAMSVRHLVYKKKLKASDLGVLC
ncbi:MAG: hypothetical protein IPL71_06120 [Anaerolineales bacterium]|uniref:hypothetical protein n=1 Tax=Candidatus Villigracilis proximus TaxID=3140683 RepID=UPI0031370E51|nr:hypothetical protein [Anaerolineales bacterium]